MIGKKYTSACIIALHTQPKLVGMTKKKLVQMVSHWTSVILVMLARLAY